MPDQAPPDEDKKVHECVHDRDDPSAIAEPQFSLMGDFSHAIGMSARPASVSFRCRRCRKIFETSTDQKVLRRYTR